MDCGSSGWEGESDARGEDDERGKTEAVRFGRRDVTGVSSY